MKFRTRLTITFAVIILLIISVELLVSYLGATRHDQQVAVRNLQSTSHQVSHTIDLLLQQASRDLAMVSRSAFLNEPGRSIPSINRRLFDFRESSASFGHLTFCGADGRVRADADGLNLGKPMDQALWQKGMAGQSGFLIQPGSGSTAAGVLFYAPVRREPGEQPKGVIVGRLQVNHLSALCEHFQNYRMSGADRLQVALLNQAGLVLFASSGSPLPVSGEPGNTAQLVRNNGPELQIITPVQGLSGSTTGIWRLQVSIPKAQVYEVARQRLKRKLVVNGVMCAVGIAIVSLMVGRLSRPLDEISRAVLRRGEGDTTALEQLPVRRDEFALLQESLQQMSARLQESMGRLTASEEQFHALFDAMAEGVALHRICYNEEGIPCDYRLEEINQRYRDILGLSRDDVVGKTATEVYRVPHAPYLQEYATVVATGQSYNFEAYYEPLQLHISISVCRIGPERFATIFSDITGRVWQEEALRSTMTQLKQANEAKSRFLAVMSHEIRTPLNGITGMVQLLQDMEMPALQQEFLDNIETSAESLLSVINDILDFSKIEAGRMELEELSFQPCVLLNDTLRVMRLRAQAKGLQLTLACSDSLPAALTGDPHRLAQVLSNLVNNAIKFTVGGEIAVQASSREVNDDTVLFLVEVRDSGIGMDAATQQAVFEPFIQADSSTTRKYGGTGLGLAICKQLVELMNGSISVFSSPGQGSTFSFSVPLKRAQLSATVAEVVNIISLDQPLQVLVAEDQPVNQRFVAEILRKQGHTPLLASNGQEALDIWNSASIDMVLMDIQMPVMDGLKALAAIRAAEDGMRRHTPIVALTAHAIVGDRERLLNAGFDGYLAKPLQVSKLFEEMARVLELISKEKRG
ncbi:MAG: ATP-binding protein [Trichlorobacter sp.]|uniref:ATP-binding protein n=1 Tax=Trichlorobacter sp. TaxID=2911007 RepID=UPI0025634EA8|nr:ATP-binding protein [Trichlorobacter sp.]MDK9716566.1 ATP-binding protein [Trichlorobacter sp.]